MDLLHEFRQNWERKEFAPPGSATLVAVSGGRDSMVLADLFLKAGLSFAVAHCNFRLRGTDADDDEQHVKDWALKHDIAFFTTGFNTSDIAAERKTGIQETARDLRYVWLANVRATGGFHRIATAHHAADNAETLLINLFRGSGIRGLHGIPEKNGPLIRPLLFASAAEIAHYASAHQIEFREDASNLSDKYLRNAVRHNILPAIETYFPDVTGRLNESIQRFRQAELLYDQAVRSTLKKLTLHRGNDMYIPVLKLQNIEAKEALVYELFRPYGFSPAQVPEILKLMQSGSGHFIASDSHRVIKDRNFLILTDKNDGSADFITIDKVPAKIDTSGFQLKFSGTKNKDISVDAKIALIDAEKVGYPLIFRKWRTGDYFYPLGMSMKKKKLSRFLIDQKIPVHEKEQIWVLEHQKKIIWVAGLRLDERFKITLSTKQVLKVEMRMH
jgi:tRNA(Ile)-lysidine synthase